MEFDQFGGLWASHPLTVVLLSTVALGALTWVHRWGSTQASAPVADRARLDASHDLVEAFRAVVAEVTRRGERPDATVVPLPRRTRRASAQAVACEARTVGREPIAVDREPAGRVVAFSRPRPLRAA